MSGDLRSVTVKMPSQMFEQIKTIADKRGETISDAIRRLITKGLEERIYEENTELLTKVVREEMERTMDIYFNYQPLNRKKVEASKVRPVDSRRLSLCRRTRPCLINE